jgi:hypothetical protein
VDEDRTTAAAEHPLDAHREGLITRARVRALTTDDLAARDALAALLEDEQGICARDAIRIAHAWISKKKTPPDYRLK